MEVPSEEEEKLFFQVFFFDEARLVEDVSTLQAKALVVQNKLEQKTQGHIWQHEALMMRVPDPSGEEVPAHLGGSLRFGDNVEDEWLSVSLLFWISEVFPDSIIKLWDSDGELLLIEAAEALPKWLEPETSDNRVVVAGGKLHIVPQAPSLPQEPTLRECLSIVRATRLAQISSAPSRPISTEAPKDIQQLVMQRLKGYPKKAMEDSKHRSRCYVPRNVARLLEVRPQLLSAAVRCFYERGPEELKAASKMARFGKDDWVCKKVGFTRCLYAQMTKQQFFPPKGVTMPPVSHPMYRNWENGVKLSCAFEMLYSKNSLQSEEPACFLPEDAGLPEFSKEHAQSNTEMAGDQPAEPRGTAWEKFSESLKKTGYFRGELEGSRLYRELMATAKRFFMQELNGKDDTRGLAAVIDGLLKRSGHTEIADDSELQDDPEDWLNLSPKDLEEMLSSLERSRTQEDLEPQTEGASRKGDQRESTGDADPGSDGTGVVEDLVKTMGAFVDKVSSHKGAELPKEYKDSEAHAAAETEGLGEIGFDPERFLSILGSSLGVGSDGKPLQESRDGDSGEDTADSDDWGDEDSDEDDQGDTDVNGRPVGAKKGDGMGGQGAEELDELSLEELMNAMDSELEQHPVAKEFEREKQPGAPAQQSIPEDSEGAEVEASSSKAEEEEEERLPPVDVELNLVTNILKSYKAQGGAAGPASNIYGMLGVELPEDDK